jgi:hypothetical protein
LRIFAGFILTPLPQRFPNFFIVGAPKAGTTTLYRYLERHPQVFMSSIKEPSYFAHTDILAQQLYYKIEPVSDWEEYLELFSTANGATAIGEASVSYLFYPDAAKKLHNAFPAARIVILLRDPVERAWSHYLMDYKLNLVTKSFDEIISGNRNSLYYQQYVKLGLYAKQVEMYLNLFGKEQVFIGLHDELKRDYDGLVKKVCSFLNVEPLTFNNGHNYNAAEVPRNSFIRTVYASPSRRALAKKIAGPFTPTIKSLLFKKPVMKPEDHTVQLLQRIYQPDLKHLEILTGMDLRSWYE